MQNLRALHDPHRPQFIHNKLMKKMYSCNKTQAKFPSEHAASWLKGKTYFKQISSAFN